MLDVEVLQNFTVATQRLLSQPTFFFTQPNPKNLQYGYLHLACFVNPKTCHYYCCAPSFFSSKAMTTATHRHWERINLRLEGSSSNLESWKLRNGANGQRWWTKPLKWASSCKKKFLWKSCARVWTPEILEAVLPSSPSCPYFSRLRWFKPANDTKQKNRFNITHSQACQSVLSLTVYRRCRSKSAIQPSVVSIWTEPHCNRSQQTSKCHTWTANKTIRQLLLA